ncbi:TPA: hypothetical protein NI603_007055 [Pseudomonas aeruginosa]|nr:hypothetical protein [Pseudomonas aeruginosa]
MKPLQGRVENVTDARRPTEAQHLEQCIDLLAWRFVWLDQWLAHEGLAVVSLPQCLLSFQCTALPDGYVFASALVGIAVLASRGGLRQGGAGTGSVGGAF